MDKRRVGRAAPMLARLLESLFTIWLPIGLLLFVFLAGRFLHGY
jgi:hypothetical protein